MWGAWLLHAPCFFPGTLREHISRKSSSVARLLVGREEAKSQENRSGRTGSAPRRDSFSEVCRSACRLICRRRSRRWAGSKADRVPPAADAWYSHRGDAALRAVLPRCPPIGSCFLVRLHEPSRYALVFWDLLIHGRDLLHAAEAGASRHHALVSRDLGRRAPRVCPAARSPRSSRPTTRRSARPSSTEGPGQEAAGFALAFRLIEAAQQWWSAVNAPHLVALVGAHFEAAALWRTTISTPGQPSAMPAPEPSLTESGLLHA